MRSKPASTSLGNGLVHQVGNPVVAASLDHVPSLAAFSEVIDPHSTYMRLWDFILATWLEQQAF